ncbi:Deoxyribonuclease-2-alpha [Trichinella zimbabwensis]|uniref:Deoxyribonuclease-2-alpha n=1 Tax=Trichinella zimbabwensis TaxID=268475 RepID=A0A0V1GVL5_9BILA|nr:Deoxyribonuclease-2-alpha [Trichinella zimbabwensis]
MAWKEWDVNTLFEHLNLNVEALTLYGKDPRTSEVTAAEFLIVLARELLPFRTKIKWDEVAASDESAHSDLSRFLQFLQDRAEMMQERRPLLPASGSNPPATSDFQTVYHNFPEQQYIVINKSLRGYVFLFTFNTIMKTFFVLFLLGIQLIVETKVGQFVCRRHDYDKNAATYTDWWIQYKGPDGIDKWLYVPIDNVTSPLIETIDQYVTLPDVDKAEVALVAYNSFPPYFRRPVSQSSSRGVVAWGDETGYAFWLVHTISRFPNLHEANSPAVYAFAQANEKAAMIMCLSIEYQDSMWAKVAYYEDAVVFYYRSPQTAGATQDAFNVPDIQTLLGDSFPSLPSSYYSSSMKTAGVPSDPANIFVAAKYGSFPRDMYMSLIVRTLKQSLRVWTGRGPHVFESLCNTNITIENVYGEMIIGKSTFSAALDTARWSISKVGVGKYFCLSNSGRERYLSNYPSGVVCIENEAVHNMFSKCATDEITQTCP